MLGKTLFILTLAVTILLGACATPKLPTPTVNWASISGQKDEGQFSKDLAECQAKAAVVAQDPAIPGDSEFWLIVCMAGKDWAGQFGWAK